MSIRGGSGLARSAWDEIGASNAAQRFLCYIVDICDARPDWVVSQPGFLI